MVMRIGYAPAQPRVLDILLCVLMVSNVSTSQQRPLLLVGINLHPEEKPLLVLLRAFKFDVSLSLGIAGDKMGACLRRICALSQLGLRNSDMNDGSRFLRIELVFEVSCDYNF